MKYDIFFIILSFYINRLVIFRWILSVKRCWFLYDSGRIISIFTSSSSRSNREETTRKRRFHQHPIYAERRDKSQFFTLFEPLYRDDEENFFGYIRMAPASFDRLFELLQSGLTKKPRPREAISAKERLPITLYFLAHGWWFWCFPVLALIDQLHV